MKMQVRKTDKCNIAFPGRLKPSQSKKSPISKIYPSSSKTSHSKMDATFYEIGITADHQFYVNSERVEKTELALKFDTLTKNDTVAISADKASSYEDFIYVIDLLKLRNIEKIGMVVNKDE